jgi:hypothetical protein
VFYGLSRAVRTVLSITGLLPVAEAVVVFGKSPSPVADDDS